MSLFSWFNSTDQVDTALVVVAVVGAVIEAGVAVTAVINVHKELEKARKEKLEKYIEVFACIAAFFFLAEAILGWRSSMLLGKEIETLKSDNLKQEQKVEELRKKNDENEARLLLVSNAAALNSPSNFPISSVEGRGFIVVDIKDAPMFVGLQNRRAILELMSDEKYRLGGVPMNGRINWIATNRYGDLEVGVEFNEDKLRTIGAASAVTFNNFSVARLNLFPDSPSTYLSDLSFKAIRGELILEINSEYGFRTDVWFPTQTNRIFGIFGSREQSWPPPAWTRNR